MKQELMRLPEVLNSISGIILKMDFLDEEFRCLTPYVITEGNITYSNKSFLKSTLGFTKYELSLRGNVKTFKSASFNFEIYGMYTRGEVPFQLLSAFPGNVSGLSTDFSFRTLKVREILGDRIVKIFWENNFRDELFRFLKIPGLKNWEVLLSTFFNVGLSDISEKSNSILPNPIETFTHPFYEIGFGIGQVLIPLKIEFAWKLNYRGENNFRIGINSYLY